jgi:hypothetical protein
MKKEKFMVIAHYPTYTNASFWEFNTKGLGLALIEFNNETTGQDVKSVHLCSVDKKSKTYTIKRWERED